MGRPLRRRLPKRPSCTSGIALSREHHISRRHTSHVSTAAWSRRLPHQSPLPILKQSLSNSNLIGLTLLLVKAVIGPSLSKMSLRMGSVPRGLATPNFFYGVPPEQACTRTIYLVPGNRYIVIMYFWYPGRTGKYSSFRGKTLLVSYKYR